ncbi:MAG: outer membrane lipoprotein-sorting protein [Gammaproteobacteria bacterium]
MMLRLTPIFPPLKLLLCLGLAPGIAGAGVAEIEAATSAEEKGLEIAREIDRRDTGWGDQSATLRMILRNRQGQESSREMRSRVLEVQGDGDKSLLIFDAPGDVRGTAFLSFSHALEPDDQWLFLPALKRVKRIASRNKSGPFMGSEFAYEDLSSQEVDKYRYRWLRDEEVDGRPSYVVDRLPRYEHSGYTHLVSFVDKTIWQPLRIEFHDRKDALLKTLTFHDYAPYADGYWRPARLEMVNHQTGKSTTLEWSDYQFGTGLSERDFNKNALKRVR